MRCAELGDEVERGLLDVDGDDGGDHRDGNRIDRWADSIVSHLMTDQPAVR